MLKMCLIFLKSEPRYAYKRYAYKRNIADCLLSSESFYEIVILCVVLDLQKRAWKRN